MAFDNNIFSCVRIEGGRRDTRTADNIICPIYKVKSSGQWESDPPSHPPQGCMLPLHYGPLRGPGGACTRFSACQGRNFTKSSSQHISRRDTGQYLAALEADFEGVSTAILQEIRDNVTRGIGRIPKGCGDLPLPLRYASARCSAVATASSASLAGVTNRSQRGWEICCDEL